MTSLDRQLAVNVLLLLLVASSVVKATLNLTLQYELREDRAPGTVIGDVKVDSGLAVAYRPEVVDRMRFRLRSSSDQVRVNEVTGVMILSSALDRASLCPYADVCRLVADVVVRPSEVFQIVRVTVLVLSVNRHAPRYPAPRVQYDVPANAPPGTAWALPAADDPDGGAEGVQTYRIAPPPTSTFTLDVILLPDGSRDVHLRLLKSLNLSVDSYALTVLAADGGAPARTGSLLVVIRVSDVTDDGPRFDHVTYDVTVWENAPLMSAVASVRATSDHRDATIRYSFDDETTRRYAQMFAISNVTGQLLVVGTVDRERHADCLLTIVAVDIARPASLPAFTRMRVTVRDVNDNAPMLTITTLSPPGGRWAEVRDGAAPGAFLAHVAVADSDSGNASIVDCAVNSTDFRLSALGGGNDFQLTTAVVFGRGHDPVYVIVVTCSDRGVPPLSDFRSLNVLVIDAGPQFPAEVVSARMRVGVLPGTPVVRLNATSSDVGPEAEIVYSMSLIGGRVNALAIDARSGWVTTRSVIGQDSVNTTFVYLVTASDGGNPPLSAVTTLRVHVVDSGNDVMSVMATVAMSADDVGDSVGSDVMIASVVCATVIVLTLIMVGAVVFCVRRRWCAAKDQSFSSGNSTEHGGCPPVGVVTGREQHCTTRPEVVINDVNDDVNRYYNKSSSSHGSVCSVAPSSEKDSFSSTRPLRPPHAADRSDDRCQRRSSDSKTFAANKPFIFTLIPPSPHSHLTVQNGGAASQRNPSAFEHESDSGLSGSLTDSGRALTDDVDGALWPAGPPYSLTGSYCPARAVDARRAQLTSPSNRTDQPSCRRTRSFDRTPLELPTYDTYV